MILVMNEKKLTNKKQDKKQDAMSEQLKANLLRRKEQSKKNPKPLKNDKPV